MISILKPKFWEIKKKIHIRQISLIEILFHSQQFLMWLQELKYALSFFISTLSYKRKPSKENFR